MRTTIKTKGTAQLPSGTVIQGITTKINSSDESEFIYTVDIPEARVRPPKRSRRYVIGDIHGNSKALNQALDRSPIQLGDQLVFLGDYGDGFPQTSSVVDTLLELNKLCNCVFLEGNHDSWIKKWIRYGWRHDIWLMQGGEATIESYIESGKSIDSDHAEFWDKLHPYFITEDNILFVHGGWDGRKSFATSRDERRDEYLEILWSRELAEGTTTEHTDAFEKIFIGHTATKDHLPYNNKNIWNIDTGAGWNGKLTIMDVDTNEYWQSDQNEKSGR